MESSWWSVVGLRTPKDWRAWDKEEEEEERVAVDPGKDPPGGPGGMEGGPGGVRIPWSRDPEDGEIESAIEPPLIQGAPPTEAGLLAAEGTSSSRRAWRLKRRKIIELFKVSSLEGSFFIGAKYFFQLKRQFYKFSYDKKYKGY